MRAMFQVFAYELRRQGRRRAYLFMTIAMPIIALLIFEGFRLYQKVSPTEPTTVSSVGRTQITNPKLAENFLPVGIVDQAGVLTIPLAFGGLIKYETENEAQQAVHDGLIGGYYLLKPDYLDTGDVSLYFDRFILGNMNSQQLRQLLVSSLTLNKDIDPDVLDRLQQHIKVTPHTVSEAGKSKQTTSGDTSFFLAYVFSLVLLFSSFTTSGYLMQSIVEEKESRMVEILLSSIRPIDLLVGKILALGTLGLIQMLVWASALVYVLTKLPQVPGVSAETLGITPPSTGQLAVVAIYFVLGYFLLATVFASIGALVTNMREGPQLAAFITIPMVLPMYMLPIIASSPAGTLPVALSLIPFTAPLAMVSRVAISEVPVIQLVISMTLMILTIIFAMWLAGRLFRVNTLLTGKRFSLREIPNLIRERV
jgi:ABC-2 type transport system permease protein